MSKKMGWQSLCRKVLFASRLWVFFLTHWTSESIQNMFWFFINSILSNYFVASLIITITTPINGTIQFNFWVLFSTLGHSLRLTMFLEFAISPFNMRLYDYEYNYKIMALLCLAIAPPLFHLESHLYAKTIFSYFVTGITILLLHFPTISLLA